jgi:predicted enzyme related to lactoylglutathione lyase
MINYRVDDLEALLKELKKEGVEMAGEMEVYDYGKFAWIIDPDGYKVELWEPIDGPLLDS